MTLPTLSKLTNQSTPLTSTYNFFTTSLLNTTSRQLGQGSGTRTRTTRMLTKDQKLAFLTMLLEKKEIALGSFSAKVTKAAKTQAWNDMTTEMKNLGADIKDASELRGTVFQNLKKGLTSKLDYNAKTGAGRAKDLTETDILLQQIIGKNSGKLKSLDVEDSEVLFSGFVPVMSVQSSAAGDSATNHTEDPGTSMSSPNVKNKGTEKFGMEKDKGNGKKTKAIDLNSRKTQLEVEKMEEELRHQKRKNDLEIEHMKKKNALELELMELQVKKARKDLGLD